METYITTFGVAIVGIVLGSILNYFLLKRMFKDQISGVMSIFEGTKTGKEVADMIHRLNEFSKSEDAKRILSKLEEALNDLIGEEEVKE